MGQERTRQLLVKPLFLFLHLNTFMSVCPEQIKSLIRGCTLIAALKYLLLDKRHVIVHYTRCHSALSYLSSFIYFLCSDNNTSNSISISRFHCNSFKHKSELGFILSTNKECNSNYLHFNTNLTAELDGMFRRLYLNQPSSLLHFVDKNNRPTCF